MWTKVADGFVSRKMTIQRTGKTDVKLMSKKIRTLINDLATWEEEAKANPYFKGYEEEQTVVLEFIETIAKETDLKLVDDLKKKVTNLTRLVFKISQECLKKFKERKKILEAEGKAKEAAEGKTKEITEKNEDKPSEPKD